MIKSDLHWRREQKMGTIYQEDWSDMKMDYPYKSYTFDMEGRPIGVAPLKWDSET